MCESCKNNHKDATNQYKKLTQSHVLDDKFILNSALSVQLTVGAAEGRRLLEGVEERKAVVGTLVIVGDDVVGDIVGDDDVVGDSVEDFASGTSGLQVPQDLALL
jgi:hypothetical protein